MKKPPASLLNFALALLTAVLLVLAFPNPVSRSRSSWLAPVALTPLLIALAREAAAAVALPARRFAGIVYWFGICYWIQFVLEVHGGMGRWGGWAHLSALRGGEGDASRRVQPAGRVSCSDTRLRHSRPSPRSGPASSARTAPSVSPGSRSATPASTCRCRCAWLRLSGVYGISFVFALTAATIALLIVRRGRRRVLARGGPALLLFAGPSPRPHTRISNRRCWCNPTCPRKTTGPARGRRRATRRSGQHHRARPPTVQPHLIIWPEVPGPLYYYRRPTLSARGRAPGSRHARLLLFGTVASRRKTSPLNSAVMLAPDGDLVDRYDKINLVPFGEYIPPLFGWVNRITQESGRLRPRQAHRGLPSRTGTAWARSSATNRLSRTRFASSQNTAHSCW